MRQPSFIFLFPPSLSLSPSLPNLAACGGCHARMKHGLASALLFIGMIPTIAAEPESRDRVDHLLNCSTPVLDAETSEKAKLLLVQYGGDALARELRATYASRLAGLFWDQQEGVESRLVLRLTGSEPVENQRLSVCGEPLTVEFVTNQTHTREELQKLHADNLPWLRDMFPGLQGTYADERTGEIALDIYAPEAESIDIEAVRALAKHRLSAPLRIDMVDSKLTWAGPTSADQ